MEPRDAATPELWIPGPTEVRPELLKTLSGPMVGHRTPELRADIHALNAGLRHLFGAEVGSHRVAVHSCTATGLMEMALRSIPADHGDRPRVLACVNGSFSERMARVAESVGAEVERVSSDFGAPPDLDLAGERLASGRFDAVTVCLSETSSGVGIEPTIAADALRSASGALTLVDAVTHMGAAPVDATACGFDFVFGGTQKALALPPGLGLFAVSEAMLERARNVPDRGFFLDLVGIVEAHEAAAPPMTPTIPLIRALRAQLECIEAGDLELDLSDEAPSALVPLTGWERRFRRHARMRDTTAEWLADRGLSTLGAAHGGATSPTVTCLDLAGHDVEAILGRARERGFTLAPGYGAARGTSLRIGHMGDHSVQGLVRLLDALGRSLRGSTH